MEYSTKFHSAEKGGGSGKSGWLASPHHSISVRPEPEFPLKAFRSDIPLRNRHQMDAQSAQGAQTRRAIERVMGFNSLPNKTCPSEQPGQTAGMRVPVMGSDEDVDFC
jgi:hypothetical protein